ncbi:proline dehydrogenase [Halovenus sp. WSH3]|uniref:proline dehydrogenase n=1 Tax=Halovenus carboxidivorans TaxID=2692199 RepID=A0A6B0T2A4_9EURY|nr:proline dehydrogenase family protein [Halovenus carboxidivorans]MXR51267.1 proline dehydrogenase [Halovenus carboxidivorans]
MLPPIASNFVAGESQEAALEYVEQLNERGIGGILNLLGEHYEGYDEPIADTDAYVELLDGIERRDLDACISVKPSQLGVDVSDSLFERNFARIVDASDTFVWLDMEDHTTTDVTLDCFERHAGETDGNVGVCVQANLHRTGEDLQRLAELPGKVRLVKGAYNEPAEISYTDDATVDAVYRDTLEYMFREFEDGIAVGTHDPEMIDHARSLYDEYGTPYEIQMLMGVRESAQFDLVEETEADVYQYIPYGTKWLSYFYRRLRERKKNVSFAARAIVGS